MNIAWYLVYSFLFVFRGARRECVLMMFALHKKMASFYHNTILEMYISKDFLEGKKKFWLKHYLKDNNYFFRIENPLKLFDILKTFNFTESCLFGDDTGTVLTFNTGVTKTCADISSEPFLCYYESVRRGCCQTCPRYHTGRTGEYNL